MKKLLDDPSLREGRADRRLPILVHFHRSYSTAHDGTITEHGDGFLMTSIDLDDERETEGIVYATVAVADGLQILLAASASIMSRSFTIGWSKSKFTHEPSDPA